MAGELPAFSMRDLLNAGVHFGHKTMRWNPRMEPYIFGERNGIHIIDLQQTVPLLYNALKAVQDTVSKGGRVLFVGTKRQASELIADAASRCGQHYVNHRWLGGMLTNWNTVSVSINTMSELEKQLSDEELALSKKERLNLTRKKEKIEKSLGGIRQMGGTPNILFVIDTNRESLAIQEAKKLGIPIIAVIDSNSNPDGIDFPIPGNDDSIRAITLYSNLIAQAVLNGIKVNFAASGGDAGEDENAGENLNEPDTAKKKNKAKAVDVEKDVTKTSKKDELKKAAAKKLDAQNDDSKVDVESGIKTDAKRNLNPKVGPEEIDATASTKKKNDGAKSAKNNTKKTQDNDEGSDDSATNADDASNADATTDATDATKVAAQK